MGSRQQQKKSNKTGIMVIGIVFLVSIGGGGYFAYAKWQEGQSLKAAENVASSFLEHLTKQEFEKLPTNLDEASFKANGYDQQSVVEKYQNIFPSIGAEGIKGSKVAVKNDGKESFSFSYQLSMTTSLGELEQLNYNTTIKKVGDAYKVQWAPSLIFPKMTGNDKVSIQTDVAVRGEIVDRNGEGLAVNQAFDEVGIVPGKLGLEAEKEQNIKAFSEQFKVSEKEINQKLSQGWVQPDSFVPITISYEPVSELPTGATTKETAIRYYPLKEAAAQLIGYTGSVTAEDIKKNPELSSTGVIGKVGLEQAYDKELRGQDGGSLSIVDENGATKSELQRVEKKEGQQIQLTIDKNVQAEAYAIFQNKPGSAVVTKPREGDLLATVSSPSFDPNKMAHGISQEEYDGYANNSNLPFTARFATGYAPGSTFKTITGAIGLDAGTLKPEEELTINGLKWQKDASWGAYFVTRVKEASPVNLRTALVNSDNIYFAQQTLRMGEDTFRAGLNKFAFGEKLEVSIPMEPAQISNEDKFPTDILLADTGYGQGQLLITPIQQAMMYSVFQNEGKLIYPKIQLGQETKSKEAVVTANAANTIVNDLLGSVEDPAGYVHNMYNPAFSLAAKTGTAEIKEKQDTLGKENSFLLTMDRSNNQFLTIIMVEDSRANDTATNISKPLIDYLEANLK